jgi:2-iminobutanoate/2-iminopropanoate deaminase
MERQSRRNLLKNAAKVAVAAATVSAGSVVAASPAAAQTVLRPTKKAWPAAGAPPVVPGASTPPYSPAISYGNLLFLSGIGGHDQKTIEEQTKWVLDEIEKQLVSCGSSMEKVLKVNVFLSDPKNWGAMNSIYKTRFGAVPPTRTTIGCSPVGENAMIEIECIAYI